MKILTCIKQVPAKDSRYKVNDEATGILEEDLVFETNESDLYALEEALRLKEATHDNESRAVALSWCYLIHSRMMKELYS